MKDHIKEFHEKTAPFLAHHQKQINRGNKYSLETAEIMAEMYDYALSMATKLAEMQKQLAFMDNELQETHSDLHRLGNMAEVKIMAKMYESAKSDEAKRLLKDYLQAHIMHAKTNYYELKKQNKVS